MLLTALSIACTRLPNAVTHCGDGNFSASLVFGHTAQLPNCFCRVRLMRTGAALELLFVYVDLCKRRWYCACVCLCARLLAS